MIEEIPPAQVAVPTPEPQTNPAVVPVSPGIPPAPKGISQKKLFMIIGAVLGIAILISGFFYLQSTRQPPAEPEPIIEPTQTPTPTPIPNLSRIATTSAFAAFSAEIASFSATLDSFSLQDSTLAPPSLDLELGLE